MKIKSVEELVYIYGIFKKKTCVYIGQTLNPAQRKYKHFSGAFNRYSGLTFKIILIVDADSASKVESALIKTLKHIGQAKNNKNTKCPKTSSTGHPVFVTKVNRFFNSHSSAARYFKITWAAILFSIKKRGHWNNMEFIELDGPNIGSLKKARLAKKKKREEKQ